MRLKQILINLVKNALKFTQNGFIRIMASYDKESEFLTVHVLDTGKGIRAEEIGQLFSLFGKLKRTAELNSEGIGMGLMICQNLVEMNQGRITVNSDGEDQGSRFTFTMKMLAPQQESPKNCETSTKVETHNMSFGVQDMQLDKQEG